MKHGAAVLRDPASRRLRALMMLEAKIKGRTITEIAQEFRLSNETVVDTLSWARKAGLVVQQEDKILSELMPLAHNAIKTLLSDTDNPVESAKIALELYKGMLPGFGKSKSGASPAKVESRDELSDYINSLRGGNTPTSFIEGTVATGTEETHTPTATLHPEQGLLLADIEVQHRPVSPAQSTSRVGAEFDEGT